jgi:hypothetical protein
MTCRTTQTRTDAAMAIAVLLVALAANAITNWPTTVRLSLLCAAASMPAVTVIALYAQLR